MLASPSRSDPEEVIFPPNSYSSTSPLSLEMIWSEEQYLGNASSPRAASDNGRERIPSAADGCNVVI